MLFLDKIFDDGLLDFLAVEGATRVIRRKAIDGVIMRRMVMSLKIDLFHIFILFLNKVDVILFVI